MRATSNLVFACAIALALAACSSDATSGGADTNAGIDGGHADGAADAGSDAAEPDTIVDTGPPAAGEFGGPCNTNGDCYSGFCIEGPEGFVCTKLCETECPEGYDCRGVSVGEADVTFLCLPQVEKVCTPCAADFQCGSGGCLNIDGEGRCATRCESLDDCPGPSYLCAAAPGGTHEGTWCQPMTGSCWCTAENEGTPRTCSIQNEFGVCYGIETCDAVEGWVGCNAYPPSEDICDGLDTDCDFLIDEGLLDGGDCAQEIEGVGSCAGTLLCKGSEGYVCQAPIPQVEGCDFHDNDCDGAVDEDFTDEAGAWTLDDHCGTCENACVDKIPHGTGTCGGAPESPVCVVDTCDEDYFALNDFQCTLPPDVSCQPCAGDEACYGGTCIPLDGQQVCVSPCGDVAGSCQDGYGCEDIGDGVERCVPLTESCVCGEATDGQTRTCVQSNDAGKCFGEETCDGKVGWVGCTAKTPEDEQCNGLDDDCNGAVDDGVAPPAEPCEQTNEFGTCGGTWACSDDGPGVAWWCSAAPPAEDVCDYQDNDCDGTADQAYLDPAWGEYVHDEHCGACGVNCAGAIPHATSTCMPHDGEPRCEVLSCDVGYYQAGPLTCLPTSDSLCAPCESAANCATPGDACLPLDGAGYCGRDCSAENLYGVPEGTCPPGFACVDSDGGQQCEPVSGSCTCLPGDEGNTRACWQSSDVGVCFGTETCDPDAGWTGCTANAPSAEVCDEVDNDCNALADDVPGRGEGCQNTNGFGTCPGVLDCVAGDPALVCVAAVPAEDICNYADDDCDGQLDEAYPELYGSCSAGVGSCQRFGFNACTINGDGTLCTATAGDPEADVCDTLDNDCDGAADEDYAQLGQGCVEGVGSCQSAGVVVCSADAAQQVCSAQAGDPVSEVCDGLDNDCDGAADEDFVNLGTVCSAGIGACYATGVVVCAADGGGTDCSAIPGLKSLEVCDGLDNDCDGVADEVFADLGTVCSVGIGACYATGVVVCEVGGGGTECSAVAGLKALETCDGVDNDCDGVADEDYGSLGQVCYVGVGACEKAGVNVCAADAAAATCNAAAGAPSGETCNSVDDDCDGQTDEGYLNQGTGKYDSDMACGSCFTDCTEVYAKASAYGVCDPSADPTCVMVCEAGHFDLNEVPDDGCEFMLDSNGIYVSSTDGAADDGQDCGRGPAQTGGTNRPCLTVAKGIEEAIAAGRSQVLVAGGSYDEQVSLVDGLDLLGGYNPTTWSRDWSVNLTVVSGPVGTGHRKTVVADGITSPTVIEGFVIYGTNATSAGSNSYTLYISASSSALEVRNNTMYAGDGAVGAAGSHGTDGADGTDGAPGVDAAEVGTKKSPACSVTHAGGAGGGTTCGGVDVSGGSGGDAVCRPEYGSVASAQTGGNGLNNPAGFGLGGGAGVDGGTSNSLSSCLACYLTTGASMDATNGGNGSDGTAGSAGQGCSSPVGGIVAGEWAGYAGTGGGAAGHGGGGGAGGAGGGGEDLGEFKCYDDLGGTGGGGGSGACGGTGGSGGSPGGGSFGIFVVDCVSAPSLVDNEIHRGNGGQAGTGGHGGTGGIGGDGAGGGVEANDSNDFCTGNGGKGGQGGQGGHAGGGGGACGGVTYGVWTTSLPGGDPGYGASNTFPAGGLPGSAGAGGSSLGSPGAAGQDGAAADAAYGG